MLKSGFIKKKKRERHHCGDPDVDGRIILSRIFRNWGLDGVGSG